jgi:hypothetical protein
MSFHERSFTSDREVMTLPFESCVLRPRGTDTWPMSRKEVPRPGLVKLALAGQITNREGASTFRHATPDRRIRAAVTPAREARSRWAGGHPSSRIASTGALTAPRPAA